jgi:hypothetical protein
MVRQASAGHGQFLSRDTHLGPEAGLLRAGGRYLNAVDACRPATLPSPWAPVSAEKRPLLESELLAEVSKEHPLFGARVIAIARCEGCDEVVFSVETDPARFVSVHLTWRRAPEPPPWPRTEDLEMPLSRSLAGHDH